MDEISVTVINNFIKENYKLFATIIEAFKTLPSGLSDPLIRFIKSNPLFLAKKHIKKYDTITLGHFSEKILTGNSNFSSCVFSQFNWTFIIDFSANSGSWQNSALHSSMISSSNFNKVNLIYTTFTKIVCNSTTFEGTDFTRSDFTSSTFNLVNFTQSNLFGAKFNEIKFSGCNFEKANFVESDFSSSAFDLVNFDGSDFKNAKFEKTTFKRCNFKGARDLNLLGANFVDCTFG